ncbi:MAG TPA: sugar phosphate nucleotidyltransferase [bacterium]|nr:sugar phosphate nucleotidyltransferase [bacterium]
MTGAENLWAIVLAAGEGRRLSPLTLDNRGEAVPKQFCSFRGSTSMLRFALMRAERVVPPERVVTVVAQEQKRWWSREFADRPADHLIVQPKNAGTAAGILLPLFHVFLQDALATVLVFPSDHFVEDEAVLEGALRKAAAAVVRSKDRVVLLGIEPEGADSGYGWIVPEGLEKGASRRVAGFVEKPLPLEAERLLREGALWNSFMFAAPAGFLLSLYRRFLPELFGPFVKALGGSQDRWTSETLDGLYRNLPVRDFSTDLLERAFASLWLVDVPPCGWTDLGTPERVERCMNRFEEDLEIGLAERIRGRLLTVPQAGEPAKKRA